MMKISIWQKVFLVLFGMLLTLFILEIGLRIGGASLRYLQENRNRLALRQKGAYRILCIGESTTQSQYPPFLEQILNRGAMRKRFSVIDKGLAGITTSLIASELEEFIRKYSPDMVVAMMGINDGGLHMPAGFGASSRMTLESLKVYKLMQLLSMHVRYTLKSVLGNLSRNGEGPIQNEVSPKVISSDRKSGIVDGTGARPDLFYEELGRQRTIQQQIPLAREAYRKACELNPYNLCAGHFLAELTDSPEEKKALYRQAFQRHKDGVETNLNDIKPYLLILSMIYSGQREYQAELEDLLKKILARDPKNKDALNSLGFLFFKQARYDASEGYFKLAIEVDNTDSRAFDYLAVLYHDTGRMDLCEEYLRRANKLRPSRFSLVTINNYKRVKAILDAHKIKLVCVQYPMRDVESLKEIFAAERNIIYVDNESVFKTALKKTPYKTLFRDMFAGDFGHCTVEGNKILAKNIAEVILKVLKV